jgi:hypothetical protein
MLNANWLDLVQAKTIDARDIDLIKKAIEVHLAGQKYRSVLNESLKKMTGNSAASNAQPGMPHYLNKSYLQANHIPCKADQDIWYAGLPLNNRSEKSSGAGARRMVLEISASLEGVDMEDLSRLPNNYNGRNEFKAKSTSGVISAMIYSPAHYNDADQKDDRRKNKLLTNCPFVGYPVGDAGYASFEDLLKIEKAARVLT